MSIIDTQNAIRTHGAQAVYDAANRRLSGDHRAVAAMGLDAATLADALAIQSAAYAELGEAARAIDFAKAQADLSAIKRKHP